MGREKIPRGLPDHLLSSCPGPCILVTSWLACTNIIRPRPWPIDRVWFGAIRFGSNKRRTKPRGEISGLGTWNFCLLLAVVVVVDDQFDYDDYST